MSGNAGGNACSTIFVLAVTLSAATPPALDLIKARSLEGDLSFLSSDLLEGRATPSRGLDIAAEYIASEFRRAGLEPGGDSGYSQTAHLKEVKPPASDIALSLDSMGESVTVPPADVHARAVMKVDLVKAPAVRIEVANPPAPATLAGKIALVDIPYGTHRQDIMHAYRQLRQSPALAIVLVEHGRALIMPTHIQLVSPGTPDTPLVETRGEAFAKAVSALPAGANASVTLHIPMPESTPVTTQNVIGVLRGSDPVLAKTCVVLSAHYDHLGMSAEGQGDRIYNGANDDGSGTVSVIEIAAALATMNPRPKRTIVFVTFFGEEVGLVGSQYFVHHPRPCALADIAADVNLEQVGRTDSSEGPQVDNATITGFDFTSIAGTFERAGRETGIRVYNDPKYGDDYFARSDNQAFADAGVPANTLSVAFMFPDYHAVGDEWQKIDYANMAKVDRAVALGLLMLADSPEAPQWNSANPKTAAYVEAARKLRSTSSADQARPAIATK